MKDISSWIPSKFEWSGSRFRSDRSGKIVSLGSILISDLIADWYQQNMQDRISGAVLDLGCGRVPLYSLYKDSAQTITCVDWVNSHHDIGHIDVAADLNEPLPLDSNRYDVVILSDVLEHIAKPWVLWSEIARITRTGGILIGNVPFMYWIHEAPHDYHRYTSDALHRYAKDNGFRGEIEVIGGLLDVLGDISSKIVFKLPLAGGLLARAISWTCRSVGNTAIGEQIRRKTGAYFPLAYGFVLTRVAD